MENTYRQGPSLEEVNARIQTKYPQLEIANDYWFVKGKNMRISENPVHFMVMSYDLDGWMAQAEKAMALLKRDDDSFAAVRQLYEKQLLPHASKLDSMHDKGGQDWESLVVGWAMGKGLSVKDAYRFARYIGEA